MSTTKRTKKPALVIKSMTDAETHLADYAKADSRKAELTAKMEQQLTAVREKFDDELQELAEQCDEKFNAIQIFFEGKRDELLTDKKKSVETAHGTIGFRTGTPKLKLFKGFGWDGVLEQVKKILGKEYVRVKEEVDKERLISEREEKVVAESLTKSGLGCFVAQDETFYIELKKEEVAA